MKSEMDPISQLKSKFRDSLFERGMKRYQKNSIQKIGKKAWRVMGLDEFGDSYSEYQVHFRQEVGKYHCSCYNHAYGGSRQKSICSHVMAVLIHNKMKQVEDSLKPKESVKTETEAIEKVVDEVWPHPEYRTNQQEVIIDALRKLFEEGFDYYIVSAPTGFGKSPVCYTLSHVIGLINTYREEDESLSITANKILNDKRDFALEKNGYYVTPQNILLDQLEDDYGELPEFGMLKGRRHYQCSNSKEGESCADGPCRYNDDLDCDSYGAAKRRCFNSSVSNTNFSMYMIHPQIRERPGLVVDEAHMMPEYVLSKVSVELREDTLKEWKWDIPNFNEFAEYVKWMNPKSSRLEDWIKETADSLRKASNRGEWNEMQKKLAAKVDRTRRLQVKMQNLVEDYKENGEPWVVEHTGFFDERRKEKVEKVIFRPITPYRFMNELVFDKAEKSVISSATPPQAELLGLNQSDVYLKEIESEFPVDNRPIYYDPIGKMSKSNRKKNGQKAALKIKSVSVGRTLVHCHTYNFANQLNNVLQAIGVESDNIIQQRRDEGRSRESYVEEFKEGDAQYLLSVNMYDGLDLKDDYCRTNIMCIIPFPYRGDPQFQKRVEVEGEGFANWRTAMRLMQGYGRAVRSKEDWANFYILDSNFGWFYKQNRSLFFRWFAEAVKWKP